ncbi:MAG: hypothetical protein LUI15_07190 [Firmicutes bacterium]|nr:hypothetical protein [Bacillota bacterium]
MENSTQKKNISEKEKNATLESLWLNYYNDTLFAKGIITERERNKMRLAIKRRHASKER